MYQFLVYCLQVLLLQAQGTVNPLLNPPRGGGAYLTGGLTILEKMMVSVLHEELEYEVKRLEYNKVGSHAAEDQNQIRTSSW